MPQDCQTRFPPGRTSHPTGAAPRGSRRPPRRRPGNGTPPGPGNGTPPAQRRQSAPAGAGSVPISRGIPPPSRNVIPRSLRRRAVQPVQAVTPGQNAVAPPPGKTVPRFPTPEGRVREGQARQAGPGKAARTPRVPPGARGVRHPRPPAGSGSLAGINLAPPPRPPAQIRPGALIAALEGDEL
jgi:hypothetical protein